MNTSPHDAIEQAAEWAVELDSTSSQDTKVAFQTWLSSDPEHQIAWQKINRFRQSYIDLKPHAAAVNVVQDTRQRQLTRRVFLERFMALGGLSIGAGLLANRSPVGDWLAQLPADQSTNVGEQRNILTTAGALHLNTYSAINMTEAENQVIVELIQGELAFTTEQTSTNKQTIVCEQLKLYPHNANYALRRHQSGEYTVSVQKGHVTARLVGQERTIHAQQSLNITNHQFKDLVAAQPYAFSWIKGRLEASDISLDTWVAEISRYTHGYIHLDSSLNTLAVMGSFPLHSLAESYDLLQNALPVTVQSPLPYVTFIRPS